MSIDMRNRLIILSIAICIIIFGSFISSIVEPLWYVFPFQLSCILISIVLLFFSNKAVYRYISNSNAKKKYIIFISLTLIISILSFIVFIVFLNNYGNL